MNRIRQIRELRGISQSRLAELCNTTQPTIQRLETGDRQLTETWMRVLAKALNVRPSELIDAVNAAEIENEIAPDPNGEISDIMRPLAKLGLSAYRVVSDSVSLAGVAAGSRVVVDSTPAVTEAPQMGAVVVLLVSKPNGESALILRQFIPPSLATTNRPGTNLAMSLDDPAIPMKIVGVVRRA